MPHTCEREKDEYNNSFWMEHYPKLRRYCHFLAQNQWDGDDIAQETYLKALKYVAQPQPISSALLNKIAYHHWIDLLRKRKNETIAAVSEEQNPFFKGPFDEVTDSVELLVKQFTPKQAVIFLLKEAFQYQVKEIAEMLEMTEVAVKSTLHRAKRRLEKTGDQEPVIAVEAYWEENERELLSELFYESLKRQDPAILIQSIPSLKNMMDVPRLVSKEHMLSKTFSPSSTLCMAA